MMNTLQEIIKEMEVDFSWASERYSYNLKHGYFATAEKYERLKKALEKYIPKLKLLLSDKPTVAITETAHFANTMLSEVATSESHTHIGGVGAGSSETQLNSSTPPQLNKTDCSTQLPPSGMKEFDELIKQFQNSDISFLQLTSMLWNKGYEAGKEYCSGGN